MSSNDYTTIIKSTTRILCVQVADVEITHTYLAVRHTDMYKPCDYERDEKGHVIGGSAGIFDEYVTLYNEYWDEPESVTVPEYPEWVGELCDAYCEKRMCGWDFKDEHGVILSMVMAAQGCNDYDLDISIRDVTDAPALFIDEEWGSKTIYY